MSLASLKRSIRVGTLLKLVRHDWLNLTVRGNTGTSTLTGPLYAGLVRPVVLVQSNQIALETPGSTSGRSYITWPKADRVRETDKGFQIDLDGTGKFEQVMEYEFVPQEETNGKESGIRS